MTEKSGCWVGAHGLDRRSYGWVWQHNSGGNQKEQQREDAKVVGSIVLLWWEDMGHVEASDWLVWRASLRTEGGVALVDKIALMEMSVGGGFTA